MNKHRETITTTRASCDVAELFLLKYEAKLPEDLGRLYVCESLVMFDVHLSRRTTDARNKALTHLGDTFGRSDWDGTMNCERESFDWSKTVDGVKVKIYAAQPMGQPKSFPVDPKQFPLQLE